MTPEYAERAALLAVARRKPARDRTLCETLYFTGCRPSELVETRKQIDALQMAPNMTELREIFGGLFGLTKVFLIVSLATLIACRPTYTF